MSGSRTSAADGPEQGGGPLRGVRVLDLTRFAPGAFCTLLLADLGAEVVKAEAPGSGDGLRAITAAGFAASHVALNRGKRSVALDLRKPGAGDVLRRLVADADILVESSRPGQLDGWGLGWTAMSAVNPQLVWCSITGFGDTGPHAGAPGHDLTYLGASGLLGRLADGDPSPPPVSLSLPVTGLMAMAGILAALTEARRTGRGSRLDANMTDTATWLLSEDVARAANAPAPGWGSFSARNVYRCADGRHVTVAANEPRTWSRLCQALGADDLAGHRLGIDLDEPVRERLEQLFATKDAAAWTADPGLAGGVGPVHDAGTLLDAPQTRERGSLVTLEDSGHRVFANPLRFHGSSGAEASLALREPPELGQHTDEVLRSARFTESEVAQLHDEGVVA